MKRIASTAFAVCICSAAFADLNYWNLAGGNFSQDWTNTGLITANDDWSGVASITGYLGDVPTTITGVDPQTILDDNLTVDVIANQLQPNSLATGGVAEFEQNANFTNSTIALQGSGTADYPYIKILMNSTGRGNVTISYNVRDIDGSADNAIQQVALQYRLTNSGNWINVPQGYIPDATSGPSQNTLVTPISVSLAAWYNQPTLEFRVMTTNAPGNDEWVGIDDISVTSQVVPEPASLAALGLGAFAFIRRRKKA